ncbi:MAG: hypothetical protein ACRYG7_18790 [Janthinobacterium lividum]
MDTALLALPAHRMVARDPIFDIELSEDRKFYLKMRAAGLYLTQMKSSIDMVMMIYEISYEDIEKFVHQYPEDSTYYKSVINEKAAY